MEICYTISLIVIGARTNEDFSIDIPKTCQNSDQWKVYRGACIYKNLLKGYSLRLTKNGYFEGYIKKPLLYNLSISKLKRLVFRTYENCHPEGVLPSHIHIYLRNINIGFKIKKEKEISFYNFCFKINNFLSSKYIIKVCSGNEPDNLWVGFSEDNKLLGFIKIQSKDAQYSNSLIKIRHTFSGVCITNDIDFFFDLCQDIKNSQTQNGNTSSPSC